MTGEETIRIGAGAERLMADPAFRAAYEAAEVRCFDEWRAAGGTDEREAIWHRLKALEEVLRELRCLADGRAFIQGGLG